MNEEWSATRIIVTNYGTGIVLPDTPLGDALSGAGNELPVC